MNPAFFQRAFPFLGLGAPSPMTNATVGQQKSVWPSPIGFPMLPPSMWPNFSQWSHFPHPPFPHPFFTMMELDRFLYGYMRRSDDPSRGIAVSTLQTGNHLPRSGQSLSSHPMPAKEPTSNRATTPPEPTDLPSELFVSRADIPGSPYYGVFAKSQITRGTRYGPYRGKIVQPSEIKSNDSCSSMWEVFDDGKLSHYVDGRTQNGTVASWMSLVQCARCQQEQNMEVIQQDGEIYYQATRDIAPQSELLVWYGESYDNYLGVPTAMKLTKKVTNTTDSKESEESLESFNGFSCERCGKMFTYKYYLDKHLKFTRCVDMGDRGYPCPICDRSFEKRDRLRIHILHVHEKYKPHVCAACGKAFSQSSSLNKHIRVHTGVRPYKCVHCAKTFTASSILRTHIRQHSGEKPFKCKFCGKSFASHAAHDSHVRRSHVTRNTPSTMHDPDDKMTLDSNSETGALLVDV